MCSKPVTTKKHMAMATASHEHEHKCKSYGNVCKENINETDPRPEEEEHKTNKKKDERTQTV